MDEDDECPYPSLDRSEYAGWGMGPDDWLHVASFGPTVLDRANIIALQYFLKHKFPGQDTFAVVGERNPDGSMKLVHIVIPPWDAVWRYVHDLITSAMEDNGRISDEIYEETCDKAIQETWENMKPVDRIFMVKEARAPWASVLWDEAPDEIVTLLYRALE